MRNKNYWVFFLVIISATSTVHSKTALANSLPGIVNHVFTQQEYVGSFLNDTKNPLMFGQSEHLDAIIATDIDHFYAHYSPNINHNNNAFLVKKNWLHKKPISIAQKTSFDRYAQKIILPPEAIICFIGDIHGSAHSLVRNLLRLQKLGYLDKNFFCTNEHFYLVFLGDYINYGRWSAEVLSILLKLKLANWEQVFLLAGNHEIETNAAAYKGFLKELTTKFGKEPGNTLLDKLQTKVFNLLPVALFISCKNTHIQCCHGGIEPSYNPKQFVSSRQALFHNLGNAKNCRGLFWNTFCEGLNQEAMPFDKHSLMTDRSYTIDYLKKNNLKAIMRGHYDTSFGLKLFKKEPSTQSQSGTLWLSAIEDLSKVIDSTFRLADFDHYPVFTFTTAAEGKAVPFDCFGLMQTKKRWEKWLLKVHEYFLGTR